MIMIDGKDNRSVVNEGKNTHSSMHAPIFVGGLMGRVKVSAVEKWHLRSATSFEGQIIFLFYCSFQIFFTWFFQSTPLVNLI